MNKKTRNLFLLIFFLSFLATILIAARFLFFKKPQTPPSFVPTPSPVIATPTPVIQPLDGRGDSQEKILKDLEKRFPLQKFLPYTEENFTLGYIGPLFLKITLKKDAPEIRQGVLDWIWSKGVDPATHQIKWEIGL